MPARVSVQPGQRTVERDRLGIVRRRGGLVRGGNTSLARLHRKSGLRFGSMRCWWCWSLRPVGPSTRASPSLHIFAVVLKDERFHDLTNYIGQIAHLRGEAAAMGSRELPIYGYPVRTGCLRLQDSDLHLPRPCGSDLPCVSGDLHLGFAVVAWCAARAGRAVRIQLPPQS